MLFEKGRSCLSEPVRVTPKIMPQPFEREPDTGSQELSKNVDNPRTQEFRTEIKDESLSELFQAIEILSSLEKDLVKGSSEVPWLKVRHARRYLDEALKKHLEI